MGRNPRPLGHRSVSKLAGLIGGAYAIVLGCTSSCTPAPEPKPPTPVADAGAPLEPDAALPPETGTTCERACARLQRLDCPEGAPLPGGEPCTVWLCRAAAEQIVDLQLDCVATMTDCREVDGTCRYGGEPTTDP